MARKETNQIFLWITTLVFQMILFGTTIAKGHEGHSTSALTATYSEIKAKIEEYQSDDFTRKKSQRHYFATDVATNTRYEIHFDKKAPKHFKTGNVIELKGIVKGSDFYLNSAEAENFAYANGPSSNDAAVAAAASGNQNTLVIIINSTTATVSCSAAQITDFMFNSPTRSVNYMYQEASNGSLSFSGQVYTAQISVNSAGACDYGTWASKAQQAAGVSSGSYNKVVYVLPPDNSCGWAGLGMIGSSGAYVNGRSCGAPDIYAHELGHNLGMGHANSASGEYMDYSDVMGISGVGLRTVNAPHKIQMGWLPSSKVIQGSKGVFEIAPLEVNPALTSLPQVITLKKSNGEILHLSYRRKIGYDSIISSTYADRLNIHTGSYATMFKGALADGESYADTADGITVSVLSHTADSIQVQIDAECRPNTPALSLSPAVQGGAAGQSVSYNVTLKNNDSYLCPSSTFNLAAVLPAGFSGSLSSSSLTVAPGLSASASLSLASPATSTGEFLFQISSSGSEVIHSASVSGKVIIDSQAPTAPGNLTYSSSKGKINLLWSASSDNVAVARYEIYRNGSLLSTVQGYSTGSSVPKSRTTATYQVRAVDAAGNKSAFSNAVTIGGR
ncbi:MAG: peptidase gametolysin [Pseudobdellovibrio sp.]|nr:peptidase gametolysin [Pseudobdellovibrio sp.]